MFPRKRGMFPSAFAIIQNLREMIANLRGIVQNQLKSFPQTAKTIF